MKMEKQKDERADLKAYNAQFYKKLFGPLEENNFTLDELRKDDVTQVTQAKNEFLVSLQREVSRMEL